jgi:2-dehydro-3-deoxyphosphogluconate aldolase/(4S)-4-hydroxy-2-oxoglutarate aldolase
MNKPDTLRRLGSAGVVAVVRAPDAEGALRAVDALVEGGIRAIEITYTTPRATEAIAALSSGDADIVLGAGTVLTPQQAAEAADAGAQFIVTPGTNPTLAEAVVATGTVAILGAFTPSEVMSVVSMGADVVKIFPASVGGPAYLNALRGPLPDLVLMPTGGVAVDNVEKWFSAGAHCLGAGGRLCSASLIAEERFDEIRRRAAAFTEAVERSRR